MRKIVLILTFFTVMTNVSAQECEYTEYYPLVTAAATDYDNKKYKAAEEKLKLAFTKTTFPLGNDLHLALRVAQKRKDAAWAEEIAIKLAKGGVPLRYFGNLKTFEWYDIFKADFINYAHYYKENYNPEVREELISLLERDRAFNSKFHEWRTREIEMTLEELIDGATKIFTDFKKLTDTHGFPNERLMGYNYVRRKNSVEYYPIDALMIHTYQRGELLFKDEIQNIVCEGGLHPNYVEILKKIRGFGDSTGIEQEMKARYAKYRGNE
ncbi:MAG: hypothetical protein WD554_04050 [Flavobacteriaceae bacterium]